MRFSTIVMGFVETFYFQNMCLCCKLLLTLCNSSKQPIRFYCFTENKLTLFITSSVKIYCAAFLLLILVKMVDG